MRTLSMPPSGRTNTCASDSGVPDESSTPHETNAPLPAPSARQRLSWLLKASVSGATLALYMTGSSSVANAQFICQQYGGSFGGATAGALSIACGTNASAPATGATAFGNLTAASWRLRHGRRQRRQGERRECERTWRLCIGIGLRRCSYWRL